MTLKSIYYVLGYILVRKPINIIARNKYCIGLSQERIQGIVTFEVAIWFYPCIQVLSTLIGFHRYLMLFSVNCLIAFLQLLLIGPWLHISFEQWQVLSSTAVLGGEQAYFVVWDPLRLQNWKRACQVLGNFHQAAIIFKHSTIIWRTENCYQFSICEKFVTLINNEMPPANQINIVLFAEIVHDLLIKRITDSSLIFLPFFIRRFWVAPKYVAK